MSRRAVRLLTLLPGLYLFAIGAHLWASPRSFVRVHKLPFYPPTFKRGMDAIAAYERASRTIGLVATTMGATYLLLVMSRRD